MKLEYNLCMHLYGYLITLTTPMAAKNDDVMKDMLMFVILVCGVFRGLITTKH